MRRKLYSCILVVFLVFNSYGCTNNDIETISEVSTESEKTTVLETSTITTTQTEANSEVIETSDEPVMEDVYVSDFFPEVHVTRNEDNSCTITLACGDVYSESSVEFEQDNCYYELCRCDKKVISICFISYSSSTNHSTETITYSTSGEKINLSSVIMNNDLFISYLEGNGMDVSEELIDDLEWIFDLSGLVVFDKEEYGNNNATHIPYEDFQDMINSNYIPDDNTAMYGTIRLYDTEWTYNEHSFSHDYSSRFSYNIDGDRVLSFENDSGEVLTEPCVPYYFQSDTGRQYLWAFESTYDFYDVGEPEFEFELIYKCAMLVEITNGYPEVVATTMDGPESYLSIYDIPEDILELMNFSEW